MRKILIGAAMLALSAPAAAQLVRGGVSGAVNGATGGVDAAARGAARATVPDPVPGAGDTVDRASRDVTTSARNTGSKTSDAVDRPKVRVAAGASVRVEQGTRCYYDDYYYDPIYRDGVWYCERTGSAAEVAVGGRAGRR